MADKGKQVKKPETPEELYKNAEKLCSMDELILQRSFLHEHYMHAAALYEKAGDYSDAKEKAAACKAEAEKAAEEYKEEVYKEATAKMTAESDADNLEAARKLFSLIPGYRDADVKAAECTSMVENAAAVSMRKTRRILAIVGILVIAAVIFFVTPAGNKIRQAALGGDENEGNLLKSAEKGDLVDFGPFSWRVLENTGTEVRLLFSHAEKQADLRNKPFNETQEETTWADCSLREWLNGGFLTEHFTEEERGRILSGETDPPDNEKYGISGGETVSDMVRIPYPDEVREYDKIFEGIKMNIWILSPGNAPDTAMFLSPRHTLMEYGYEVSCTDFYVCPVISVSLSS